MNIFCVRNLTKIMLLTAVLGENLRGVQKAKSVLPGPAGSSRDLSFTPITKLSFEIDNVVTN
jgi:hypothetical protein